MNTWTCTRQGELYHHGIKGQKWGVRRFQNKDGSLTPAGERRYDGDKSMEEIIDYVKCMTITANVSEDVYSRLTEGNLLAINDYIGRPMTATTFREEKKPGGREIITSEVIYYWMVSYNIPFECQHWHLNRLLTLIKVCNVKNNPPKKMSQKEIMSRNRALNEARKKEFGTRG